VLYIDTPPFDVYIHQAHFTHLIIPRIYPSQVSLSLFEFHGKRHYMDIYLRLRSQALTKGSSRVLSSKKRSRGCCCTRTQQNQCFNKTL